MDSLLYKKSKPASLPCGFAFFIKVTYCFLPALLPLEIFPAEA